jgi:3-methyladenine DNA glycosylase Mpg
LPPTFSNFLVTNLFSIKFLEQTQPGCKIHFKMDAEVEYGEQQMEDDSGFLHPMDSQVSRDAHDQVTNSTRVGVHKVTDLTRVLRFLCVGNENRLVGFL